jgi:hypothetical protein
MPQPASAYAAAGQTGFYTCREGACVVDGTLVRVLIGLLPDGSYGIALLDQYGQTLLTPEGFGPSWAALIQSGIFNNAFQMGSQSTYYLASMQARFPNCIAYFRLGEPSGTTATDSSPVRNNGTYTNAPTLGVPGALYNDTDTAVLFAAGSSQYMEAPSKSAYAIGQGINGTGVAPLWGSYSLACWFNVSAVPGASQYLINMGVATTNGFELVLTSAGTFTSRIGPATVTSGTVPTDGFWHFVVLTMDRFDELGTFYIDGVVSGTPFQDISAENQNITASPLDLGRLSSGSNYFSGSLDEVAVFNTALSTESITWLYAVGSATATGKNPLPIGASSGLVTTPSLPYWSLTQTGVSGATLSLVQDPTFSNSSALLMEAATSFPRILSSYFTVTPLITYVLTADMAYLSAVGSTSTVGISVGFFDAEGIGLGSLTNAVSLTAATASPMSPYSLGQIQAPASATSAHIVVYFFGVVGEFVLLGGLTLTPSRLTYVPLTTPISVVPDSSSTAVSISLTDSAELTRLPIGVVAVEVEVRGYVTTATGTGSYIQAVSYQGLTDEEVLVFTVPIANVETNYSAILSTGGLHNRQISWTINRTAGIIVYYIRVMAYYTSR